MVGSPSPFQFHLPFFFPWSYWWKLLAVSVVIGNGGWKNKVLIWIDGWALYQKHVFQARTGFLSKCQTCSCNCLFCGYFNLGSTFWKPVCINLNAKVSYLLFFLFLFLFLTGYFVVSGMLDLWKQDWLKEHGETPTPPGLWAPAVFVMYHWDLRLPLETLSTFPWWYHQGEAVWKLLSWVNFSNQIAVNLAVSD